MGIKVGLLGVAYEFADYKTAGSRFYRYVYYTSQCLLRMQNGLEISTIEPKMNESLGKNLSIYFGTLFKSFDGYDLIHNFDLVPFLPLKKGKAKIVTTAHDMQFVMAPEYNIDMSNTFRGNVWLKVVMGMALKSTLQSDHIIAVSTLTRDDMVRLGYPKERITVVNHGVDQSFMAPIVQKTKGKFVVGYMGAMRARKNPMFLLNTMEKLQGNDFELHMWGKLGYMKEQIMASAGKDKRVSFKGFAPDDKFVEIYDSFDVFLFPSFYEGFGIPIIEAQARGLPVITLKGARIPDETRKYCFEAKDEAHAAQLIKDFRENGYKEKQRKVAMEYARSFTWEKTAKETLAVYKKVAGHG